MGRNPECPCRQGRRISPSGTSPSNQAMRRSRLSTTISGRGTAQDRIRLDRQDGIGLRPVVDRRPPNPREIELVTIGERETEGSVAKLRGRHQAAVGWKRPSFRTDDVYGAGSAVARPQPPRQLHHLHIAVMAPYDDAALVERGVELENLRAHHR